MQRLSSICILIVISLSLLTLFGWATGSPAFTNLFVMSVPMPPASALLFLFTGAAGILIFNFQKYKTACLFAAADISIVTIFCLQNVLEHVLKLQLHLETYLAANPSKYLGVQTGRMSPVTAVLFLLSVVALSSFLTRSERIKRSGAILAMFGFFVTIAFNLGYLYGTPLLYGSSLIPSLNSLLAFTVLSLGMFAGYGAAYWPLKPLFGYSVRARLVRVFLPSIVFLVILTGWMDSLLYNVYKDHLYIVSVNTIASLFVLGFVIYFTTRNIGRSIDNEIAARLQAERALQESERKFHNLIDTMNEGMAARDGNGRITFVNKRGYELLGYTPDEVLGRHVSMLFDKNNQKILHEQMELRLTGVEQSYEISWKRKDGENIPTITVPSILPGESDGSIGALATFTDITERKRTEKALQESERKYRDLINTMNEGVGIDKDGIITFMNRRACEMLGYSLDELIGEPNTLLFDEENLLTFQQQMALRERGIQQNYEINLRRKDGGTLYAIMAPSILYDADGNVEGTVAIFTDITKRKFAEDLLRKSDEFNRTLLQTIPMGIDIVDEDGNILFLTDKLKARYADKLFGQKCWELYKDDGIQCEACPLKRGIGIGETSTIESFGIMNQQVFQIYHTGIVFNGKKAMLELFVDITERKRAEELISEAHARIQSMNRELERDLEEIGIRNMELDAFNHMVAHDLKNPLSIIISFSDLLMDENDPLAVESSRQAVQAINSTSAKMLSIIDDLLLFANVRIADVTLEPLDMGKVVVHAMERLVTVTQLYNPQITYPDSWPVALGYQPWVEEIWMNYISNACKYGGAPPIIELGGETGQNADGALMVHFWVRDGGISLSDDEKAKLFIPFSRLGKVRAEGTGLGLTIVQRITEKLGGNVGVESDGDGSGNTFYFTLPGIPAMSSDA